MQKICSQYVANIYLYMYLISVTASLKVNLAIIGDDLRVARDGEEISSYAASLSSRL